MTIFWQTSALVWYQQWVETHLAHLMKDLMDILKEKVFKKQVWTYNSIEYSPIMD